MIKEMIMMINCPYCNKELISGEGTVWKLRTRIVIFLEGKTLAKCRFCKNDIEVPVRLNRNAATLVEVK